MAAGSGKRTDGRTDRSFTVAATEAYRSSRPTAAAMLVSSAAKDLSHPFVWAVRDTLTWGQLGVKAFMILSQKPKIDPKIFGSP